MPASKRPERRSGVARRSGRERRSSERRSGFDRRADPSWQPISLDMLAGQGLDEKGLVAAAIDARTHARAAFSTFKVGAALETSDGEVIGGCNVENATYGLTVCAERVALWKALSEGRDLFTRIAVVADTYAPTPPCGACRQILWEFGGDLEVILGNLTDEKGRFRLRDLLPHPFDARLLTP